MDATWKGKRCRAKREIRNYAGVVQAETEGTIQYEMDNLGRHLIQVLWDNGVSMNVFPEEIELVEGEPPSE